MPVTPTWHTYADVATFRGYLSGTGHADGWTDDALILRLTLEAVSRTIDQHLGGRCFGPRTQTRSYDLGRGALRSDAMLPSSPDLTTPDYWPGRLTGASVLPLDDWLISATTVTAYSGTARGSSQTLTEGIASDFLLEPYNDSPKITLKLMEETAKSLSAGQQTLTLLGVWGYQNQSVSVTTAAEAIDTTETGIDLAAVGSVAPGMTLLIDSEQMYVTALEGITATVRRGVNGTTAASHLTAAAVSVIEYPSDVVMLCLEIARNRWRERDAGQGATIGDGAMFMTRPGAEERALLKRLDKYYAGRRPYAGIYF